MTRIAQGLFATFAGIVLSGCVSQPMQIAGLEFINDTDMPIMDIELRIVETYEVAACSYLSPRGKFSTQFPLREYKGNEIEVEWEDRLSRHHFGPKVIPAPDSILEQPVVAVVSLAPAGHATTSFRTK